MVREVGRQHLEDPSLELQWESVRLARAQRRLVEHELMRRRTLLILTVMLTVTGVVFAAAGSPPLGGGLVGSGLACGAAAIPRRRDGG